MEDLKKDSPEEAKVIKMTPDELGDQIKEAAKEEPKRELTKAEAAQRNRVVIRQDNITLEAEMNELMVKLEEKDYQNFVYSEGSEVTIPGHLFAHLINFAAAVKGHNETNRAILTQLMDRSDGLGLGGIDFQVDLTKRHITNCENGVASSPEFVDKANAKDNIREVAKEPKLKVVKGGSRVKATGSGKKK